MEGSLYEIEGFVPPTYAFRLSLQGGFARKAFGEELPEEVYEELQNEGRSFVNRNFSGMPLGFNPYIFLENEKHKKTCLVSHVKVHGLMDEIYALDIDSSFDPKLSGDNGFVDYIANNINNWMESSSLLLLWLTWFSAVNSELKNR